MYQPWQFNESSWWIRWAGKQPLPWEFLTIRLWSEAAQCVVSKTLEFERKEDAEKYCGRLNKSI